MNTPYHTWDTIHRATVDYPTFKGSAQAYMPDLFYCPRFWESFTAKYLYSRYFFQFRFPVKGDVVVYCSRDGVLNEHIHGGYTENSRPVLHIVVVKDLVVHKKPI